MEVAKLARRTDAHVTDLLANAFARFTEASGKLEARQQILVNEIASLKEQLRAKEAEIKKAERLSVLGQTASALAHEVRNPLGAIKLFVSMLRRDLKDQPKSIEVLNHIERSISTLDHTVTNILFFSKERLLPRVPLNVHSLMQEEILVLSMAAPDAPPIVLTVSGNPFIKGNDTALRQLVKNLVMNSYQATKYKGQLTLTVADRSEGAVEIVVQDNGPGIPAQMLKNVFEPFVTSRSEGTGLGLAICRQIVEAHGGTIEVTNAPGARFQIVLPRV